MQKKKIVTCLFLAASISGVFLSAYAAIYAETTPGIDAAATPTPTTDGYLIPEPTPQTEIVDADTIVKSYEFTALERPFVYSGAPQKVTIEGREYTKVTDSEQYFLKSEGVHYETEKKDFTQTVEKQNVSSRNDNMFDETLFISQEGYEGEIPRVSVSYATGRGDSTTRTQMTFVEYGEQLEAPTVPDTITKSGQQYKFYGWEQDGGRWVENFYADLRIESESETYRFASGKSINLETDAPKWEGVELDLMEEMKLDAGTHILVSAKWLNSLQYDGNNYSRKVRFTISRHVARYTAIYQAEITVDGGETLNAQAAYKGTLEKQVENGVEYAVICKVAYAAPPQETQAPTPTPEPTEAPEVVETISEEVTEEKGMNPILKFVLTILAAGGIGVGGFFIKNWWDKRQEDSEES